jgi:FkbM family methyltransferase
VAAAVEHEQIPYTYDFRTVIDAGAGRGQFALFVWSRFPAATLHCFEPLRDSRAKVERVLRGHPSARSTFARESRSGSKQ